MSKNFSVDSTLFKAKAKKLVRQLKLDEPKIVKEQAGMLAQNLASVTPPFVSYGKPKLNYGTKKDIRQGITATRAGFYSVVKLMTESQGWKNKSIRAAISRGDMGAAQAILKNAKKSKKKNLKVFKYSDLRRNKSRNNRGQAPRNVVPFVSMSKEDVEAGLARALYNVGMAKASFAKVAVMFGRKKPIKDISRHFNKVYAKRTLQKNPSIARFTVRSHGLDVATRRLKEIEKNRMKNLVKQLEKIIRSNAKKAGFKTR
tara:strand:+ start:456 stop:1229 length:774 start_codon:yes stop_codon:yes gene_type:complete